MIDPIDRKNGRVPSIQEAADKINDLISLFNKLAEVSAVQQAILDVLVDMHSGSSNYNILDDLKKRAH